MRGRLLASFIDLLADFQTHTTLGNFFLKMDLEEYAKAGGANKRDKVRRVIDGIRGALEESAGDVLILKMIEQFLKEKNFDEDWLKQDFQGSKQVVEFLETLKNDGWAFKDGRLIAITPEAVSLAPEIYGLEFDLSELRLEIAKRHYQQAVDNFTHKNFEASNSQLRSFLENLYIELCEKKTARQAQDPTAALQTLQDAGHLDRGEFNLARGIFEASNERGAHHGLTSEQEATFRFHFSTALGRYLISRLK